MGRIFGQMMIILWPTASRLFFLLRTILPSTIYTHTYIYIQANHKPLCTVLLFFWLLIDDDGAQNRSKSCFSASSLDDFSFLDRQLDGLRIHEILPNYAVAAVSQDVQKRTSWLSTRWLAVVDRNETMMAEAVTLSKFVSWWQGDLIG